VAASSLPQLIRVSTDMFPDQDRFSAFREEFVRQHLAMDVIDHSGGRARTGVTLVPLGPVTLFWLDSAPAEFIRGKQHLRDGGDAFLLGFVRSGPVRFGHAGDEDIYEAGSAAFCDQGQQWRAIGGDFRLRTVTVNNAALKTLMPDPEDLAGRPLRPGPALCLFDSYLRSLAADELPPPALAPVIGGHLLDLVAAVLGPSRDAAEIIRRRGVRAARLRAILTAIAHRFTDPGFGVGDLARAVGVSRRYAQGLLEETGKSFTQHVVEHRGERAFTLLTDPRSRHLSITDIAYASGFGDVSHFNRMFRRRYGDTPSGIRAAANWNIRC
jgi:AraC-like DNA-binding protein